MLRAVIALASVCFVVGVIYATGMGKNNRALGIALIALSVTFVYPYWLVARQRGKVIQGTKTGRPAHDDSLFSGAGSC
jgi:hypothetical protein